MALKGKDVEARRCFAGGSTRLDSEHHHQEQFQNIEPEAATEAQLPDTGAEEAIPSQGRSQLVMRGDHSSRLFSGGRNSSNG